MTDPTTVSEVIEELEEIRDEHGDVKVLIDGGSGDYAYVDTKRYFGETCARIGLTHDP